MYRDALDFIVTRCLCLSVLKCSLSLILQDTSKVEFLINVEAATGNPRHRSSDSQRRADVMTVYAGNLSNERVGRCSTHIHDEKNVTIVEKLRQFIEQLVSNRFRLGDIETQGFQRSSIGLDSRNQLCIVDSTFHDKAKHPDCVYVPCSWRAENVVDVQLEASVRFINSFVYLFSNVDYGIFDQRAYVEISPLFRFVGSLWIFLM